MVTYVFKCYFLLESSRDAIYKTHVLVRLVLRLYWPIESYLLLCFVIFCKVKFQEMELFTCIVQSSILLMYMQMSHIKVVLNLILNGENSAMLQKCYH